MFTFKSGQWQRRRLQLLTAAVLGAGLASAFGSAPTAYATSGGSPYTVPLVVDTNPDPNIVETTITVQEATVDIGGGVMAHALTFNGQLPGPQFRLKVGDTVIVHFKNEHMHPTGIHWHGIELNNASDGTPLTQNQVPMGETFLYKFKVPRPGIFWYHPHHHGSTNQVFQGLYGTIVVTDPDEAALIGAGTIPGPAQTRTLGLSDITVCKTPGMNDAATYDPSLPHVSGGALPVQPGPTPATLCDTPFDEDGMTGGPALPAGSVPNIQNAGTSGRVNEGQTILTNGRNVGGRAGSPSAPGALAAGAFKLPVLAGQGLRLQIFNTAPIRFFRLILTDSGGTQIPLVRIGGQGGILDSASVEGGVVAGFDFLYTSGEILLDPGDRADVVVAIPPAATGVLTLWTQDFPRTGQPPAGFAKIPTVPVAHFEVTGAGPTFTIGDGTPLGATPQETLGPATATLLDPTTFTPPKLGMALQDIRLTATGSSLGINDVLGSHDFPGDYVDVPHFGSARYAKLGDLLELTVTNTTPAHHPFHLHGFSIQPLDLTKPASPTFTFPQSEFVDNIDVPAMYTLRFRVRLDDRPLIDGTSPGGALGRWVFHCHIFHHATFGMISEFVVVAANGNERPHINANDSLVEVDEGQTAMMTGTHSDPDGDGVTLTPPSLGTLTDNLDGTWSWSYTTTDGPDESGFLFVTATDTGGHTDQAAFELKVNNLPPSLTITSPAAGSMFLAGTPVTVVASITDPGSADVLNCAFDWGGGGPPSVAPEIGGTCSQSNIFAAVGTFLVTVTGSDDDGATDSDSVSIKIFTAMSLKQDVLAQAETLLASATKEDKNELKEIVKKLTKSLDPELWIDGNHLDPKHGNKVFDEEKVAVDKLMKLIKKSSIPVATLQAMIDALLLADRSLAEVALGDAIAAAGDPKKIADAQEELLKAADEIADGHFDKAVEHYKKAWKKAQEAVD